MRIFISIFFLIYSTAISAQSEKQHTVESTAKTLLIELASLNQLTIQNSEKQNIFSLTFNNHSYYTDPQFYEEDGVVYLKVLEDKSTLPRAQQHKYRAGQPVHPNYTIAVPKNIQLRVSYTKGNFTLKNVPCDMELYIDHGVVDLGVVNGSVFVQSYDGVINCQLKDISIDIASTNGTISTSISDEKVQQTKTTLKGTYGDAIHSLRIKTVYAKVNVQPL